MLPEPDGSTARNDFFVVMADEMLSAQYVAMVGEMFALRFSRMLPVPAGSVRPVFVHLVAASDGEPSGAFRTRIHASGQVDVTISWGEDTSRETVERALVQGHLTYLSGAYSAGSVTVPLWLELAGQHLTRVQAVPAHGHYLGSRLAASGPMRLADIVEVERDGRKDEEIVGANAYWLLTFLEREARPRNQLQNFLVRILRGEGPLVSMGTTYGEELRSSEEAHLWWMVGVNELVRAPGSPVPSAEESKARVKELSRFAFETKSGRLRLFPEDLWEYRVSASLQDELRHRVVMTQVEVASMHPFYYNVVVSLGRLFESVLEGNEEAYREALASVRHDLKTGDELTEDTRSLLDDLAAELAAP